MPSAPVVYRPKGARKAGEAKREHDERRGSARNRGYTSRWDKARRTFIAEHPLCEYCALEGEIEPTTVVDHLFPHRTYGEFWRTDLWVGSCKACHDGMKAQVEARGHDALVALARRLRRPILPPPTSRLGGEGGIETSLRGA